MSVSKALIKWMHIHIICSTWLFASLASSRQLYLAVTCPIPPSRRPLDFADAAAQCGPDADCSTCSCAIVDIFTPALAAAGVTADLSAGQDISNLLGACLVLYENVLVRAGVDRASLSSMRSCLSPANECVASSESLLAGSAAGSFGFSTDTPPGSILESSELDNPESGVLPAETASWVSSTAPNCTQSTTIYVDPISIRLSEENGLEFTVNACPDDNPTSRSRPALNAVNLLNAMTSSSDLIEALEQEQAQLLKLLQSNITSRSFNAGRRNGLNSYVTNNLKLGRPMRASRILGDFKMIALPEDFSAEATNNVNATSISATRASLSQRVLRSNALYASRQPGASNASVVTLIMWWFLVCMC